MTFTQAELLAYTQGIVSETITVFSSGLAALILLNYSVSFGFWLYRRKVEMNG